MEEEIMTTEQKILEAAVEIFGQKGFNGTTTKEIAQRAGIAEGTIFRYFPKKKDILYGILLKMLEVVGPKIVGSGLKEIFENHEEKSDREVIMAFIQNRVALIKGHMPLIKVVLNETQYHPELQGVFFEKVIQPVKGIIDEFFQEGIKKGRFKNIPPTTMTLTLLGFAASNLLGNNIQVFSKNISPDQLLEETVEIFLKGILK
ncbi:AcrR family transcriptional regulator [Anaerosolibacter carboniphilus]|uniref:AcrR family transcriptional regulator n=1 Tax=Anaerosolibacter carboniphilus TaxID=1417629 RepID=A0A841KKM7_9FIRM|nr:TetR/AcrR family transcriptional regulator [Anaerosolibacter carboniphilus]MBB6213997.1 AcrR family transcriptional regulator [Anaerosolibacter carboniphilus]